MCDENLGLALEYLLAERFNLNNSETAISDEDMAEMLEQRKDEMVALEAIYEDRFMERIPLKVWIVKLNLPYLDQLIQPSREKKTSQADLDNRETCRFFARGFCKFGRRCRMKHSKPEDKSAVTDLPVELAADNDFEHEVEIRFPTGNLYPREAPFLAFTSTSRMDKHICLNITKHMIAEAKNLAEVHEPSVFSVISLLDNDSFLDNVVTEPPDDFSSSGTNCSWINHHSSVPPGIEHFEHRVVKNKLDNDTETDEKLAKATDRMIRMSDKSAESKHEQSPESEKVELTRSSSRDQTYVKKVNPAEILKTNRKLIEDFKRKQVHRLGLFPN